MQYSLVALNASFSSIIIPILFRHQQGTFVAELLLLLWWW
jgi:hypothetical protein